MARDTDTVPLAELLQLRHASAYGAQERASTIACGFLSHPEPTEGRPRRGRLPNYVALNVTRVQQHGEAARPRRARTVPEVAPALTHQPRRTSASSASRLSVPRRVSTSAVAPNDTAVLHKNYGAVPGYLHRHALERYEAALAQEQAAQAAAEAAAIPPGMRLVTAAEREAALEVLRDAREQSLADIAAFPLALNNAWRQRRRLELDAKLAEVEEAIRLYQLPQAYLPSDAPPFARAA
jgi:hypothetical protein